MIEKQYYIIDNAEKYEEAIEHIRSCDYLTYDTETNGLNTRKDSVIGFGFTGMAGRGYYLPTKYWDKDKQELLDIPHGLEAIPLLEELAKKELIMHNASFDIRITLANYGIDLTDSLIADTMLLKHTLEEEGPFGLKAIAIELQDKLGLDAEKEANEEQIELIANITANGGSTTKTNYELYKADMPVIGKYCCADVDLTLRVAEYYNQKLEEEGLCEFFFDKEVMPLYKEVTIPMEMHGVKLDLDYINDNYLNLVSLMESIKSGVVKELQELPEFEHWLSDMASEKYPVKTKGRFAQYVVDYYGYSDYIPRSEKTKKYSLTKKNIESLEDGICKDFLLGDVNAIPLTDILDLQKKIWEIEEGELINISSKLQLKTLVFDYMDYKPLSYTDKKQPQFNDDMVQFLADEGIAWATQLRKYNKLFKIKSSYYDRFLEGQEDGQYYFSYKQHGTISGRYGSDAQQLPRPMEEGQDDPDVVYFNNTIRRFFISGEGRKFIDSDYESLEPHVFAHVSNDEGLRDIFRQGNDFYSTIAIQTEKLDGLSADKKADNYLGKVDKPRRQNAKAYSLGVPYGMTGYALGKTLNIDTDAAEELVRGYLDGFPNLKKWMQDSKEFVQQNGYIRSEAGRVRHLPKAQSLFKIHGDKLLDFRYRKKIEKEYGKDEVLNMYRDYKNSINNSRNFQIQSLSASIVNRSAVLINRAFKKLRINGWVAAQIHDQLIINVPEDQADTCTKLVQNIMESYKISLDLKAPPELSTNWRDGH